MKSLAPIFIGDVKDGKLVVRNPQGFKKWVATLEGKIVQLVVRPKRKNRTLPQNAYYWGVVIEVLRNSEPFRGYTPDMVHEHLKWRFLQRRDLPFETVGSTAALSTSEMGEYMENIKMWAASDLEIFIPDPNQVDV